MTTLQKQNTFPILGWIGLGSMGLPMAINLQRHLRAVLAPNLRYHNRTLSRGTPLQEIGGIPCEAVSALLPQCHLIFLSLSNDAAVEETITTLLHNPSNLQNVIFVDTSTIHPSTSSKMEEILATVGATYISAPVFGASPVAEKGKLLMLLSGNETAILTISPYLVGVLARATLRLGTDIRQASLLKTAGNLLTAGLMELIAETHILAEKTGIPSDTLHNLLEIQYGPLAASISTRLTTGAYCTPKGQRPQSDLGLAIKDVGHGLSVARDVGVRLHVGEVCMRHLREAEAEKRVLDSSALYGVLRREAGLGFESEVVRERDAV